MHINCLIKEILIPSKAPQLLLLPGFDGTGELFAPLQSALGESVDTVVVRYLNEVLLEDYIETVASLLKESDRETVLVAESFSGPIALSILARYPKRVRFAVLCATYAVSPFRLGARLGSLFSAQVLSAHYVQALLLKTMCLEQESDSALSRDVLTVINSVPAHTIKSRLKVLATLDVRPLLSQIATPTLYLQAMQDRLVGAQLSQQLISGLENVSVREIDGPHMLLQSRSHGCAEAILEFIEI